jgi:hypothetical protein
MEDRFDSGLVDALPGLRRDRVGDRGLAPVDVEAIIAAQEPSSKLNWRYA